MIPIVLNVGHSLKKPREREREIDWRLAASQILVEFTVPFRI